ncbi:MAG: hypothetical protein KIT33_04680 [Candidatus Kapabacteria bacterium]|nr:hypothetical protein [Ignavibacteriota bacterium]MCW5884253.1 hypothetical protein [Candidatus Kapabacteria bacterium]
MLRNSRFFILLIVFFTIPFYLQSQFLPGDIKPTTVKPRKSSDGLAGSGYAGLSLKAANTINQWGLDVGAQFGGMLSDRFGLGGAFYTLFTQNVRILPEQPYFLRLNYGGIEPRFVFKFGDFAVHTKLLIGLGFAGYSQNVNFDVLSDLDGDWIGISEPSVGLSYAVSENLWISFDAGWRITGGVDFKNITAEQLNGSFFTLTLKTFVF